MLTLAKSFHRDSSHLIVHGCGDILYCSVGLQADVMEWCMLGICECRKQVGQGLGIITIQKESGMRLVGDGGNTGGDSRTSRVGVRRAKIQLKGQVINGISYIRSTLRFVHLAHKNLMETAGNVESAFYVGLWSTLVIYNSLPIDET